MNETTVALTFLLVVLIVAAVSTRKVAVLVSLIAFGCFNFFFLPPVGTFAISRADDLVALFTLLSVSLIGSHLSHLARRREIARRGAETKSALVASLSHDVKTPLTALTVAAGNLSLPELSDEQRQEQLQIIRLELERLTRLFEHVIDMASVEAAATRPQLEWVTAADIVEAARRQVEQRLASHPVHVAGETELHLVRLDPRLTSSALAHVLENAAVYSPAAAPITIEVMVAAEHLRIAVRDAGPGLAPGETDRIFERFYRGGVSAGDPFSRGMGLAITRGLLTLQGGTVTAANAADGGAVFTLDLPVATRVLSDVALDIT